MDGSSFDSLTRLLSETSRRGIVATLATAFLSAQAGRAADPAAGKGKRQRRYGAHHRPQIERHKKKHRPGKKRHKHKPTASPPVGPGPISPPPGGCVPHCAASKPCGDDGCGGLCGTCASNETCQRGTCVCVPRCGSNTCGPDGCGGTCGAGCTPPETCNNGACGCIGNCEDKQCGDNGCGQVCGFCESYICHQPTQCIDGVCVAGAPIPNCCSALTNCSDGNPCTVDRCSATSGSCEHVPETQGTPCTRAGGTGICNASGTCVECLTDGTCADDGNACTDTTCQDGQCQHPPLAAGATCTRSDGGAGVCDGTGACVQCVSDAHCDAGNPCVIPRCEPNSHTCAYANKPNYGTACGGSNYCENGVCHPCEPAGKFCLANEQCCGFSSNTAFCGGGVGDPFKHCCRLEGNPCQTNTECCNGVCAGPVGNKRCCSHAGEICENNDWCCEGTCIRPNPPILGYCT